MSENIVTIKTFMFPTEAYPIISKLESEGIQCFLDGEHTVTAHPFLSQAIGGVKLNIMEKDADLALKILAESEVALMRDDVPDPALINEGYVPVDTYCKNCESRNVYRKEVSFGKTILSALVAILVYLPMMLLSQKHYCADCGHEWKQ